MNIRIVCCADIHGDFSTFELLKDFVNNRGENIDLIVCSGDLLLESFDNKEYQKFKAVSTALWQAKHSVWSSLPLGEFAHRIISRNPKSNKIKDLAKRYLELLEIASKCVHAQYKGFKEIVDEVESTVLIVPGNYDCYFMADYFEDEYIHLKTKTIQNLTFAGYGGAKVVPSHIPEDLLVAYNEGQTTKGFISEPYSFLSSQCPDVTIVHTPPYGCCDVVGVGMNMISGGNSSGGHVGSIGIRAYVLEQNPNLVVSGHIHEAMGVEKLNDSYVINPGNLGRFYDRDYGTFMEVELDGNGKFSSAVLYRIDEQHGRIKVGENQSNK
jgi:Icc-related predicted phosphoesterase